jgi:hypothetical protein
MRGAQQVFVLGDLLKNIVECGFDSGGRIRCRLLRGHLSGWQAQIQRYHRAIPLRILLDRALQVN